MPLLTIDSTLLWVNSSSNHLIDPLVGLSSPEIVLSRVLLPAPFAPITVVIQPGLA